MNGPRPRIRVLALLVGSVACGPGTDDGATTDATDTGAVTTTMSSSPTTGATATSTEETGTATTEPIPGAAECAQDSDCMLVNDCCQCDAKPLDAEIPPCEGACLQSTCDALSLQNVRVACRLGVCEFADEDCSEGPVTCDQVMPSCPESTRLTVQDGCWGPCVHPRYCIDQPCPPDGCGAGWACVEHQASASDCVVMPFECAGTIGCDCAAPFMDEFCVGTCAEVMSGVSCQDGG